MAQDIAQGLFGQSPWQVSNNIDQQTYDKAKQFAMMNAAQRGAMGLYQGGSGIGDIVGGMLGLENPAVAEAKRREAALGGLDLSSPEAVLQRAAQIQDPRLKMQLQLMAQSMKEKQQELALKRAQELAQLHKAQAESSPLAKIDPSKFTKESVKSWFAGGMKDPSVLVPIEKPQYESRSNEEKLVEATLKARGLKEGTNEWNTEATKLYAKLMDKKTHINVAGTENDMDDMTVDFIARQALTGDKSVLVGLARTKGALAKVRAKMATLAKELNISPEQLAVMNAEYFGQTAGQRSLGTRTAAIELAANEANKMADITLNLFPKVNPSQFPSLNALKNAVDKQIGGPDVVALNTSLNSLINIYARAINPTGVATVSDKEHARALIDSAMGSKQLPAAIAVMKQEMEAALSAPGEVKSNMRNRFLNTPVKPVPAAAPSLVDQIPGATDQKRSVTTSNW